MFTKLLSGNYCYADVSLDVDRKNFPHKFSSCQLRIVVFVCCGYHQLTVNVRWKVLHFHAWKYLLSPCANLFCICRFLHTSRVHVCLLFNKRKIIFWFMYYLFNERIPHIRYLRNKAKVKGFCSKSSLISF